MIHPPTPIWSARRTDDSSRSQAGRGSSSHRARDANTAWTSASDGTLEEHRYHCQNQHADVVALITAVGAQREMARYSAYGVPFGLPVGDTNSDGDCDQADQNQVRDWALATPAVYDVRGDLDLDGDVDLTDRDTLRDNYKGVTLGRGVLSAPLVRNQRGVAGYVAAGYEPNTYLIRHRVFPSELGVWASRDPLGYVDKANVYQFCWSQPAIAMDASGLSMTAIPPHRSAVADLKMCEPDAFVIDASGSWQVEHPRFGTMTNVCGPRNSEGHGVAVVLDILGMTPGVCNSGQCQFSGIINLQAFNTDARTGKCQRVPPDQAGRWHGPKPWTSGTPVSKPKWTSYPPGTPRPADGDSGGQMRVSLSVGCGTSTMLEWKANGFGDPTMPEASVAVALTCSGCWYGAGAARISIPTAPTPFNH